MSYGGGGVGGAKKSHMTRKYMLHDHGDIKSHIMCLAMISKCINLLRKLIHSSWEECLQINAYVHVDNKVAYYAACLCFSFVYTCEIIYDETELLYILPENWSMKRRCWLVIMLADSQCCIAYAVHNTYCSIVCVWIVCVEDIHIKVLLWGAIYK